MKFNCIKTILIFIIVFCSVSCYSKNLKEDKKNCHSYIKELLRSNHYSENIIIISLIHLNDYSFLIPDTLFDLKYTTDDLIDYLDEFQDVKDIIFYKLDSCINLLSLKDRKEKLDRIISWCDCYYVFNYTSNLFAKQDIFFAEIMSEIEITAKILYNMIDVDIGQDWDSLSTYEGNVLFFDVVTYISSLTPNEQLSFYQEYFEKLKK